MRTDALSVGYLWHFFLGIGGVIAIFLVVGAIGIGILNWIGFFEDRSFQCAACQLYTYDSRWLAVVDNKNYCIDCWKRGAAGPNKARFTGHCAECGEEYPLASMVGMNERTLCYHCWHNRLWPKDWKRLFKEIREQPRLVHPPAPR